MKRLLCGPTQIDEYIINKASICPDVLKTNRTVQSQFKLSGVLARVKSYAATWQTGPPGSYRYLISCHQYTEQQTSTAHTQSQGVCVALRRQTRACPGLFRTEESIKCLPVSSTVRNFDRSSVRSRSFRRLNRAFSVLRRTKSGTAVSNETSEERDNARNSSVPREGTHQGPPLSLCRVSCLRIFVSLPRLLCVMSVLHLHFTIP